MKHNLIILTEFAKPTQFKVFKKPEPKQSHELIHGEKSINCHAFKQPIHWLSNGIAGGNAENFKMLTGGVKNDQRV